MVCWVTELQGDVCKENDLGMNMGWSSFQASSTSTKQAIPALSPKAGVTAG
jgi:hypothetical protein